MGNRLLKKIIEKIGVEKKNLETIDENKPPLGRNTMDTEDMQPDSKKMRMMNDNMDVDGIPIESKE